MASPSSPSRCTRLAPSPTGALHLGNARTFLITWAMARQAGWKVILRIEDLDGPRVKPGVIDATVRTLRWLGLDWDGDPIIQSHDLAPYRQAMHHLARAHRAYPSEATRGELENAASAPQEGVSESRFPPKLRPARTPDQFDREDVNWRFKVPEGSIAIEDVFAGPRLIDVASDVGDFLVWTKRGQPSYQLAVVVDDHRQGVTDVIRGDDLLASAARQKLVYQHLGYGEPWPTYTHVPLVRGEDGRRLAKRHGDTRVDTYRDAGVTPDRLIGLLASWSGIGEPREPEPMDARRFAGVFRLATLPRNDIIFTSEHDRWLRTG